MLSDAFIGEWKLVSSENTNELLKKLDMNPLVRKVVVAAKPTIRIGKISSDSSEWSTTVIMPPLKPHEVHFKLGEVFTDETPDGRHVRILVRYDAQTNQFVIVQYDPKDPSRVVCEITREIMPNGEMKTVSVAGDVIATQIFKKIK